MRRFEPYALNAACIYCIYCAFGTLHPNLHYLHSLRSVHDNLHCSQVGKHLGDVQAALPLRSVCKDWADTVTMNSESARLDLHPEGGDDTNTAIIKSKLNVFKLCPNIKHLTYYVSPRVTSQQVRRTTAA